jgi:hypothetical protein
MKPIAAWPMGFGHRFARFISRYRKGAFTLGKAGVSAKAPLSRTLEIRLMEPRFFFSAARIHPAEPQFSHR